MEDKIKVLFFISSLEGGGAERVMVNILGHIERSRIEPVLVLLYPVDKSPYKDYLPEKIKVIVVERHTDTFFEKVRQFINFCVIVRREKPGVLLSMLTHNNIMAIVSGIFLRTKVIVCEHITLGEVVKKRNGKNMLGLPVAPVIKILYRFADKVITVSDGIRRNLIDEFRIPAHKIQVIYNPIDHDHITGLSAVPAEHPFFEGRSPVVIGAGRLARQKRFDSLIKAFSLVVKYMDARLIILGEGPERIALAKLVGDLGLEDKVSLAGFHGNPYKFFSRADVFVLSSCFEGLPMVILEAMACGAPVISTDCKSGPREILHDEKHGILVPVGDDVALSEAILKLLGDKKLRESFSMAGKERARDFAVGGVISQYVNLIYEVAAGLRQQDTGR